MHADFYRLSPRLRCRRSKFRMVFWQSPPLGCTDTRNMFSAVIATIDGFSAKGGATRRHLRPRIMVLVAIFGMASCAVSPVGDGSGAAAAPEARREAVT